MVVGKTTTIAKLANYYTKEGKRLLLLQVIHSRAAAADQLSIWADRVGVPIVKHKRGADPAAVVLMQWKQLKLVMQTLLL